MNIRPFEILKSVSPSAQTLAAPAQTTQSRFPRRERDFGIGYGSSSGYASNRRYTSEWTQPLFRCA